ncbi:MAG: FadR family transcriptional regulator [Acidisphaera sp.]|nr:FadR family transcriptional regulator [Acidisphaera sp.]
MTFASMKQGKAAQQIAARVRRAVLAGELQIGDRLPPERELIRLTGYSRAVVREGLRILEADGLIALHAGRNGGAVIERPSADRFASTLDVLLCFESIGVKEVSEVLSMFETRIVELAVDRVSAHDLEDLRRTITRIEEDPKDVERVRIESNRFHILLAEATRNRMLALLARIIRQVVIRMDYESHETSALQIAKAHQRILDAIIAKDVETAKRRALRHLMACGDVMSAEAKGGRVPLTDRNSRLAEALAITPRPRNDG